MLSNLNRRRFLRTAAGVLVPAPFVVGQSLRNPAFVAGLSNNPVSPQAIGYSTVGSSTSTGTPSAIVAAVKFIPLASGTLNSVSVYGTNTNAAQKFKFALYSSDTPGSLASSVTEVSPSATWTTTWKQMSVSFAVTKGTTYWLSFQLYTTGSSTLYYNSEAGTHRHTKTHTYASAFPDPFGTPSSSDDVRLSITGTIVW